MIPKEKVCVEWMATEGKKPDVFKLCGHLIVKKNRKTMLCKCT